MDFVADAIGDSVAETIDDSRWWGLEFNPAPGDLAAVESLASDVNRTAKYLRETYEALHEVQTQQDMWLGGAAKEFTEQLGELPKFLDHAQQSMGKVGKLLTTWRDELDGYQRTARDLEQKAEKEKTAYDAAEQNKTQAQANPALDLVNQSFYSQQAVDAAQAQYDAAAKQLRDTSKAATDAYARLAELKRQAKQLLEKCIQQEARAATGVGSADDGLAPEKTFWEAVGDVMDVVGDIAGVVGAVAGCIALFVGAPFFAPLALAAGGVALLGHSTSMVTKGEFDLVTLGADALGVIPGIKPLAAGFKAVSEGGTSLRTIAGLTDFGHGFVEAAPEATRLSRGFGEVTKRMFQVPSDAKRIGELSESAVNLGLQEPTVAGWIKGEHDPAVRAQQPVGGYAGLGMSANASGDVLLTTIGKLAKAAG